MVVPPPPPPPPPTSSSSAASPVPITVLSGFLGAGKTTIMRSLMRSTGGMRIGFLVNDMGDVGIDGQLLAMDGAKGDEVRSVTVSSPRCMTLMSVGERGGKRGDHVLVRNTY